MRIENDSIWGPTAHRYFGVNSQQPPTIGFSEKKITYDERGNITSIMQFDEKKNVIPGAGCAKEAREWDHFDRHIETRCLDESGNLVNSSNGYAFYRTTYDRHHRAAKKMFFDKESKPARVYGRIGERIFYDALGRTYRTEYIGSNGEPDVAKYGDGKYAYFAWERKYLPDGRQSETRHFNADGTLQIGSDGDAIERCLKWGRLECDEKRHFDTNNQPMSDEHGRHALMMKHGNFSAISEEETQLNEQGTVTHAFTGKNVYITKFASTRFGDIEHLERARYTLYHWKPNEGPGVI